MVINLAPVSLSNKKVNFYTCPRVTFLKKNATEKNTFNSISKPLDFKIFWWGRGSMRLAPLALETCLVFSLFWSLATALLWLSANPPSNTWALGFLGKVRFLLGEGCRGEPEHFRIFWRKKSWPSHFLEWINAWPFRIPKQKHLTLPSTYRRQK